MDPKDTCVCYVEPTSKSQDTMASEKPFIAHLWKALLENYETSNDLEMPSNKVCYFTSHQTL